MDLSEASRQYQDALEYDRRARGEFGETMSADDILEEALTTREAAWKALSDVWAGVITDNFSSAWDALHPPEPVD